MHKKIFKSDNMEIKKLEEKDREVTAIASKEIKDRDGDIVRVAGINIKNFKKNPVILFAHDHYGLPIAKGIKIWKEDDKFLMVKMKFADAETNPLAETVYKLIKNNYLKALSIGFRVDFDKAERLPAKDGESYPGWDFKSTELFEISVVPVPANPAALIQSKAIKSALDEEIINNSEYEELTEYFDYINKDRNDEIIKKDHADSEHNIKDLDVKTIYDYIFDVIDESKLVNDIGIDDFIDTFINSEKRDSEA